MKKIILFSVCLISQIILSQNFDKFENQDGIKSIVVNKKMFQLMANVKMDTKDQNNQLYLNLIKKLDNLKVFTTSSAKASNDLKTAAENQIKTAGLEELMRVNENGKNIRISVKSTDKSDQIKELLMFIESTTKGQDSVLMSLSGDFTLEELSVLTDKMNIPGGEAIKNASKK